MILFILKRKWKLYFCPVTVEMIVRLCSTLSAIILPYILSGFLYQLSIDKNIDIDPESIFININRLSILLPALFHFFPSIKYKEHLFQTYHPVSIFKKSFIELIVSIFSKTLIYIMFLATIFMFILFKAIDIFRLFDLFMFAITGILLAELLLTSFYLNKKYALLAAIALFGLTAYYPHFIHHNKMLILNVSFLLVLNFYLGIYYNRNRRNINIAKESNLFSGASLLLKIMVNNRRFRTVIITALVVQAIFSFVTARYALPEIPFIKYYLVLPIAIYTYCYNNLWGFFPSLAINYLLSGKHIKDFALLFFKLLLPILIICQTVSIFAYYLAGYSLTPRMLAGIVTLNVFSFVVAFWFSLLSIKKIEREASFDTNFNNSNLLSTYVVGVVALLFGILDKHEAIYTLLLAVTLGLSLLTSYSFYKYSSFFLTKFKTRFAEQ